MPYGCLSDEALSAASQKALQKAVEQWQGTMQISKPGTFIVLAAHEDGGSAEIELKRALLARFLNEAELSQNVVTLTARNEEDLANRLAHNKAITPIQTLIVFAESRHVVSLKPIFKRKFGKAVEIKKFRSEFEFSHPWISTSSPAVWSLRNLLLRGWFEIKRRTGRSLRKRLRFLFWS